MSVYLGNQMVGISHTTETLDEGDEILTAAKKAELEDAVGYRTGDYAERTVNQMITELDKPYNMSRDYDFFTEFPPTQWTRPQAWPDLDSLNLQMSGNDFIYMTYDNTSDFGAIALHVEKVSNGTNITVAMGHISNGSYVVDETITGDSNNYVRWFTNSDPDYPVVRVTGDIKYCYCYSVTDANGAIQNYRRQPILERISYVPHLVSFCTSYQTNAWCQYSTQREVFNNGETGSALTSLYYAWAYGRDLAVLDITGLKTPNVTNFSAAFRQLYKLKTLDLTHLTVNKVTNMAAIFQGSRYLRSIDLTGWNTAALTDLSSAFDTCTNLQEIKGLSSFNTAKVTTLASTFSNCRSLKNVDLSQWDIAKVKTLNSTFLNCYCLKELDIANWDVGLVTNVSSMFNGCYSLKRINFPTTSTGVLTTVYALFRYCWALQKVDLTWLNVTSSCTSFCYIFNECKSLLEINFPVSWDVSGISNSNNNGHSFFLECNSLQKITGITNWAFDHTNSMTAMFKNCFSLREVDVSGWTVSYATNLSSMFEGCYSLKEVDVSDWTPNNCTTFASMFNGCHSLTTVGDISNWNTAKVTTMGSMFRYCYSLKELPDMSDWDFSKVTSIGSMFSECLSLKEAILPNMNLPSCTSIEQIFRYDYQLTKVNLSNWTIPKVVDSASYYQILGNCHNLRDIIGFTVPAAYTNLSFLEDYNLTHDSLLVILNALPQKSTSGFTLRITDLLLNELTDTEKAIATNKNWTLATS